MDGEDQVLQVVRIRNIAISQAEEDFQGSSEGGGSSRLLKLTLTDGKHTMSALDIDNSPKLSWVSWLKFEPQLFSVLLKCGHSINEL